MNDADFDFLSRFLKERSGIVLTKDKMYLVDSRLTPLVRARSLPSLEALVMALKSGKDLALAEEVIDAMTTNETFFFRDKVPFERFADVILPALKASRAGERRIRIWCAAASTGQEPYSLAMMLKERAAEFAGWRIEIVATDISPTVIEKAKAGLYSQFEVQRGLPIQLLVKYFEQKGDKWQLSADVRGMVQFRMQNLLRDFTPLGPFDVIFCRNVLIYFDEATRSDILSRMARIMSRESFLVLGAAETVVGLSTSFKTHSDHRGLYVLAANGAGAVRRVAAAAS